MQKIKLGQLGLKRAAWLVADFQARSQGLRRAYWLDGKNYCTIRRHCHRHVCGDLRRDGPEDQTGAQVTRYTAAPKPEGGAVLQA